jgi:glycosyltransferase involved in cell wall biosynthesis
MRALYICYLSLDDPLVHTQVVAYLRGLAAAGHRIHLLTFETRPLTRSRRGALRRELAAAGITWHGLRYHKRPSLPATAYDTLAGALYAAALSWRLRAGGEPIDVIHARAHVPAAMALIARRLAGTRMPALIFDIRGLMAEEYEDAGRWHSDEIPFRLTKAVERTAIARAQGIVVLTERLRRQLFGEADRDVFVIPCCADVDALAADAQARERTRAELGLGDETVMVYVGKFGGWYMANEMAQLFAVARSAIPNLHFLVLTQSDRSEIDRVLARRCPGSSYTISSAPPGEVGRYLAAADFGISFIRPTPSKASSSPTKIGEYLAAGLPVLSTAGVGDLDELITPEVGVLVRDHTDPTYNAAMAQVEQLLAAGAVTRLRCRTLARVELSLREVGVPRYLALYDHVASQRR